MVEQIRGKRTTVSIVTGRLCLNSGEELSANPLRGDANPIKRKNRTHSPGNG
jgi:hypothetical protein